MLNKPQLLRRLLALCGLLLLCSGVALSQLFQLQILSGEKYVRRSAEFLTTTSTVSAARGEILDRYGRPLVTNNTGFSLVLIYSSCGVSNGNVLLRRTQYRTADDPPQACRIARMMVFGKIYNARWSIERTCRDHAMRVDTETLKAASAKLKALLPQVQAETDSGSLRGLEGAGAAIYFDVFDRLILNHKDVFSFTGRSRRPPLDPCNALLSFAYSLLANDCAAALEAVGLDSYVGFLHTDRPGRQSLAADLMEELRPCFADRFVLSAINLGRFSAKDFEAQENGAVYLSENARKTFLQSWQEKKREEIRHPYLEEKLSWGMVPYAQALLLARYLRGDLDDYPPFLWK